MHYNMLNSIPGFHPVAPPSSTTSPDVQKCPLTLLTVLDGWAAKPPHAETELDLSS